MAQEYKFEYGDPGLHLELYLPTKFEGLLLSTLDRGFDIKHVRERLTDPEHAPKIRSLLQNHNSLKNYDPERVQRLNHVLEGYSIYRVAGAFRNGSKIEREEVSVTRIMFLAPLKGKDEEQRKRMRFWARRYIRFWTHQKGTYLDDRGGESSLEAGERTFLDHLERWLDDIAFFMNGYVLYQVGLDIIDWRNRNKIEKAEDEIWVSSFRSLAVNRLKFVIGQIGISTEEQMSNSTIKCSPDSVFIKPNDSCTVVVLVEDSPTGTKFETFGYDNKMVDVKLSDPTSKSRGSADFEITSKGAKGVTKVGFAISGDNTCFCKVVVTEAAPPTYTKAASAI